MEATAAGVVVSTSAGNDGPTEATVAHRSPWVLSTAASSHNRKFTSIVNFSNSLYQGITTLAGEHPFTENLLDKPVIYSGEDEENDLGCNTYPANFFAGSIALIKRGTCTFSVKVLNAEAAGAIGVLIYTDDRAPGAMTVEGSSIPNVMLDIPGTVGDAIAAWVASASDDTVSISAYGRHVEDAFGDIMANFSSRGPNTTFDVLKPDVSAPGLEILAAVNDGTIPANGGTEVDLMQGTSMSSPHDAGAAALLKALHPDWTPAEIKSALMLTGYDGLVKEDKTTPADPFDIGAGRIQLELAGLTGLVMNETIENYEAANPDEGGDPRSLNLPSLYHSQCVGECSWTRTFTSVADLPATYTVDAPDWITVDPESFTIPAGGTQTITITADVADLPTDEWLFGNIEFDTDDNFSDAGAPISDVAIPVAVMPSTGNLPDLTKFVSHRDADGGTLEDLLAVEITELTIDTYGFVKGELNQIQLAQDPTNGSPYDDLSQVWYTVVPMDAGSARLVAEITATTAVDLDLFWGFDLDGDGLPSANEEYQNSATATAYEYLSEWGFPVGFYDVWILVQNWQGSGAPLDDITLSIGNVPYEPADPADPATMTVLGPETNPAGEPFTLDILWHDIDTEAGDRLYGLIDVYADAEYETSIGLTQLDVRRGVDDVVKTADVTQAGKGQKITYTIQITNYADQPNEYQINDVLPQGLSYVEGSATGGAVYDPATNAVTWSGTIQPPDYAYKAYTSAEDPACTLEIMPDGNPDAYLDWKTTSYGFSTSPSIYGDSIWYSTFSTYPAFNFYGVDYTGMHFTDDGYAGFDFNDVDYINQEIPDPTDPNNVLAAFWDDMVIQYDSTTNKSVTLVGDGESFATIEYDDVYLWGGNPAVTMDVEIGYFLQPDNTPGAYEIVFAFDNIQPSFLSSASGTIGVENADGTVGTLVSYNDPNLTITNGSAICFNYEPITQTHTITFQVLVDNDALYGELINEAAHDTASEFTISETASALVTIINLPPVAKDDHYETDQDITLNVPAPGVLANDFDPDPTDEVRADLKTAPLHGSLILNEDGSFIYIPEAGFFGTDSFVYYMIAIPSGPAPLSQFVDEALVTIVVKPAFTVYLPLLLK